MQNKLVNDLTLRAQKNGLACIVVHDGEEYCALVSSGSEAPANIVKLGKSKTLAKLAILNEVAARKRRKGKSQWGPLIGRDLRPRSKR